jgi:hypothetical protein
MTVDPFTSRSDLLLAARQLSVLIAPFSQPVVTNVEDPSTGNLLIPTTFIPMGLHAKKTGGALSNAQDINDIESHGHGTPTRQLPTKRTITLGFEPQETTRYNLEHYWGADWSAVAHSAFGGVTMAVTELPLNIHYRVILLGKDDFNGLPIYLFWIGNKVNINKTQDQKITDAEVITYPYTLNFQSEDTLNSPLQVGMCGTGIQALIGVQDMGFVGDVGS